MITHERETENIPIWHRDILITPEALKSLEDKISLSCYKYLIGKICEREKSRSDRTERISEMQSRIGQVFGHSGPGIKNLVTFMRAVDRLLELTPEIASGILTGKLRISYRMVQALAKMNPSEIRAMVKTNICDSASDEIITQKRQKRGRPKRIKPNAPPISVKDTPAYDPDAGVTALMYTIPSWVSAMERTFMNTDFCIISSKARGKLLAELIRLKAAADAMIALLAEEHHG